MCHKICPFLDFWSLLATSSLLYTLSYGLSTLTPITSPPPFPQMPHPLPWILQLRTNAETELRAVRAEAVQVRAHVQGPPYNVSWPKPALLLPAAQPGGGRAAGFAGGTGAEEDQPDADEVPTVRRPVARNVQRNAGETRRSRHPTRQGGGAGAAVVSLSRSFFLSCQVHKGVILIDHACQRPQRTSVLLLGHYSLEQRHASHELRCIFSVFQ